MQNMVRVDHQVLKLAGISGATALVLGIYGARGKVISSYQYYRQITILFIIFSFQFYVAFPKKEGVSDEFRQVFKTANRYHFLHSIVFMGVPLCRSPFLVRNQILYLEIFGDKVFYCSSQTKDSEWLYSRIKLCFYFFYMTEDWINVGSWYPDFFWYMLLLCSHWRTVDSQVHTLRGILANFRMAFNGVLIWILVGRFIKNYNEK